MAAPSAERLLEERPARTQRGSEEREWQTPEAREAPAMWEVREARLDSPSREGEMAARLRMRMQRPPAPRSYTTGTRRARARYQAGADRSPRARCCSLSCWAGASPGDVRGGLPLGYRPLPDHRRLALSTSRRQDKRGRPAEETIPVSLSEAPKSGKRPSKVGVQWKRAAARLCCYAPRGESRRQRQNREISSRRPATVRRRICRHRGRAALSVCVPIRGQRQVCAVAYRLPELLCAPLRRSA